MSRLLRTGLNAGDAPPIRVVGGEGSKFILDDGRKVVDASNTAGSVGHNHPRMVEAIQRAANAPIINEGWFWAEREKAAEDLVDVAFANESWVGAVRFFLSGSEANDLALSFSQAFTGRAALATRERAYHGMTGLSREITVQPQWHGGLTTRSGHAQPTPSFQDIRVIPAPSHSTYGKVTDSRPLTERMSGIDSQLQGAAAVIVDYTQGGKYYDAEYQNAVAAAADRQDALWIADEVVTGLGRSGRWFAFQGASSRPDIVTLGKPLAGGYAPAGAVVLSSDVMDQLDGKSWQTYSTFRGHPQTVASVRAYLQVVREDALLDRARDLERLMSQKLVEIAQRHPSVTRVDGAGVHWTIELGDSDWRDWLGNSPDTPIASQVANEALKSGALIGTSGERASLFLAPPLNISEDDLNVLFEALDQGLSVADTVLNK